MELIGANLRRFVANRHDEEAACAMMAGSTFAGISFAWARLGNVHAMSHPVSGFFGCCSRYSQCGAPSYRYRV